MVVRRATHPANGQFAHQQGVAIGVHQIGSRVARVTVSRKELRLFYTFNSFKDCPKKNLKDIL